MKTDNTESFRSTPVPRAVLSLVAPTVISQLITVIYNMADTFFIGQMNDPNQVAAASPALPLFLLTTGMANLFGIGWASLVSRCLGAGGKEKAKRVAAFSRNKPRMGIEKAILEVSEYGFLALFGNYRISVGDTVCFIGSCIKVLICSIHWLFSRSGTTNA